MGKFSYEIHENPPPIPPKNSRGMYDAALARLEVGQALELKMDYAVAQARSTQQHLLVRARKAFPERKFETRIIYSEDGVSVWCYRMDDPVEERTEDNDESSPPVADRAKADPPACPLGDMEK